MTEHFLNYEQSLAVKELGFDEPCIKWCWSIDWDKNIDKKQTPHWSVIDIKNHNFFESRISVPLKSQFFKWIRDKYGIDSDINVNVSQHDFSKGYDWYIFAHTKSKVGHLELWSDPQNMPIGEYTYDTYEQAEDACINKIIELLKLK